MIAGTFTLFMRFNKLDGARYSKNELAFYELLARNKNRTIGGYFMKISIEDDILKINPQSFPNFKFAKFDNNSAPMLLNSYESLDSSVNAMAKPYLEMNLFDKIKSKDKIDEKRVKNI